MKMRKVPYAQASAELDALLDELCQSHAPITITAPNGEDVVLIRAADYHGMLETIYLFSSPKNSARLIESTKQLQGIRATHD
ncbi:type II toxin-antitoxin system Phd/YefM family antitoxin [Duganella dendranthematis]|uniref:Antitoxin n=1 Tax=Duganella dendranthematis TaxID=2728021 RepID=A0ABX6M6X2_9BURK|nr:type II toxin-antitoxin system Phd/YefM family antitoxin [Duganella dendranthematis]QJD89943.1 type II toxin-antitoxin system Phd/YefM family antitoxin [Duganella dendranthematis]